MKIVVLLLFAITYWLISAPVADREFHFLQCDNSVLKTKGFGDEYNSWYETLDGVILKIIDGNYYYHTKTELDSANRSRFLAHNSEERSLEEISLLKDYERSEILQEVVQNRKKVYLNYDDDQYYFPSTGENKLLVILVKFQGEEPIYSRESIDSLYNQVGYNQKGSFRDFYLENSYGQLDISSTITEWLQLPSQKSVYVEDYNKYLMDAVIAADNSGVDFSQYDNNSDGVLDGVMILHTGAGAEATGEDDLYSHSHMYEEDFYLDGVRIYRYNAVPELLYDDIMTTLGVHVHEFGHNLGALDFYNVGGYPSTRYWDVMARGMWEGDPLGSNPSHHNPYVKSINYNWAELKDIDNLDNQFITIKNSETYPDFYKIDTSNPTDYFILEMRSQLGFNSGNSGHGMVIYHTNQTRIETVRFFNSGDNLDDLGMYIKYDQQIDSPKTPFPGSDNKSEFNDTTSPHSLNYQNLDSGVRLSEISENIEERTVSFRYERLSDIDETIVDNFDLNIYPNPFNPTTTITFSLSNPQKVKISLFNCQGQFIREVSDIKFDIGVNQVDLTINDLVSGVYTIKLSCEDGRGYLKRVTLLK